MSREEMVAALKAATTDLQREIIQSIIDRLDAGLEEPRIPDCPAPGRPFGRRGRPGKWRTC